MNKAAKKASESSAEMDMTPMIDIVFNLLIFFMVVTDLTQKDLADLTLPLASMATPDKDNDPDDRVILNIDKFGQIHYKGKVINMDELGSALHNAKERYDLKMKRKGETGLEKLPGGGEASKLYVLLRADKETPWQHVQWLMTIMAEQKLYKMQFASKKYVDGAMRKKVRMADGTEVEEWKILDGVMPQDAKERGG